MRETVMATFNSDGEEDAAFLSAVADAEADGLRRLSQEGGDNNSRTHERQHAEPAESVSSSLHSSYSPRNINANHPASKRSKFEPEGEYMAALRGTHSETWQAMTSKIRPDVKSRYGAAPSSASATLGLDGGGAQGGNLGTCFHCGKEGHWARDCPSKPVSSGSWGPDSTSIPGQTQVPEKSCPCGGGLCKVLTANTEKNAGRQFYRCPLRKEEGQCGFFEWCNGNTSTSQGLSKEREDSHTHIELSCPCGAGPCITLTAKTEKNMGRQFFRCPVNQGEGSCGFFKWCDESLPASTTAPAYGGSPFKERVPMRNAATGQCYKCGMDGHWAKDCLSAAHRSTSKGFVNTMPSNQVGSGSVGYGSKGAVRGFKRFGGETNFSAGFPNASGYGSPGTVRDTGGSGSTSSGGCFKCGSQGHWSRDCPNARQSGYGGQPQGSFSGRSTGGTGSCYKCGGQGHWANECRADGKG